MSTLDHGQRYSGEEPQYLPFPREILAQVSGLLDKACDRKNARLVCKGFAEAGLPSLTYTVHLSIAGGLLDRTRAIAKHPVVSKYITQLICSGTQLLSDSPNYDNFQNWYGLARHEAEPSVPLPVIYDQLVSRDKKEKETIHCQRDQATFVLAIQSFVNLKSITFTDVPVVEDKLYLARPQWSGAASDVDLWDPASPYHIIAVGMQSLYDLGTNLKQLKIVGSIHVMHDRIFSDACQEYYGHMLGVFGKLHDFELSVIAPNIAIEDDSQSLEHGSLGGLLTHATSLLTLKLTSSHSPEPPNEDDPPPRLNIEALFQDLKWRHLKNLTLHGFLVIGHEDLMDFFDRHRATLMNVEVRSVRILHHDDPQDTICEAWKELFNGLRRLRITFQTLKLSFLQDCYNLVGHFSDPNDPAFYGNLMLKYLCEGGPNPLQPVLPISDEVP